MTTITNSQTNGKKTKYEYLRKDIYRIYHVGYITGMVSCCNIIINIFYGVKRMKPLPKELVKKLTEKHMKFLDKKLIVDCGDSAFGEALKRKLYADSLTEYLKEAQIEYNKRLENTE